MEYKDNEFIKLNRKIKNWEWYTDVNTAHFFIYCILTANWKDDNFHGMEVKRGQFIRTLENISRETGLSIQNIRTAVKHLISTQELTQNQHGKYRIFTVVKYEQYQIGNTISNNELTRNQHESNTKVTQSKEVKNIRSKELKKELSKDNSISGEIHHKRIVDKWNTLKDYGVPPLRSITPNSIRERDLKARLKEFGEDSLDEIIEHFKVSKFLQGKATDFKPDFDWAIKKSWYSAILEGKYDDDRRETKQQTGFDADSFMRRFEE